MKTSKLFLAGVLAIGLAVSSQAGTTVHITGSTAVGAALNQAILDYLGTTTTGGTTLSGSGKYGYDSGSPIGGSKNAIFTDGNGNWIVTAMTGSEAGVQAVAYQSAGSVVTTAPSVSYFDEGAVSGLTAAGTPNLATAKHTITTSEVDLSDTAQSSSRFTAGTHATLGTYATLSSANSTDAVQGVGVIQFVWLASNFGNNTTDGTTAGSDGKLSGTITNINRNQAQFLYVSGEAGQTGVSADTFTGVPSDYNFQVYGIGRNIDSGTRLTTYLNMGLAANVDNACQFLPTDSTGTGAATAITAGTSAQPVGEIAAVATTPNKLFVWPTETINQVPSAFGNGGYSSGGNLSKALGANYASFPMANVPGAASYTPTGLVLIGYAGYADATNGIHAITSAAKGLMLTWEGVGYTDQAIEQGQYTFWSYEHMYYKSTLGTTNAAAKTIADGIAGKLVNETVGFIPLSLMNTATNGGNGTTARAKDGDLVTHF